MATDFRDWITLPEQLSKPDGVADAGHQITLFKRALGAVFNGMRDTANRIRREWMVTTATLPFLIEHGADRVIYPYAGEPVEDFRARVLTGLRSKKPGETKAGMRIALNTLGLKDYVLLELYHLPLDDPADKRWNVFEVRYPDAGNEGLTDGQVQERINKAKPPRAIGIAVRYRGDVMQGFGMRFGQHFGT
jgi:hypothetical protein